MDGIEKFAVFGRYWQPAQAHVDIHSQYVGDCGATAPESRRKSAKTEKNAFRRTLRNFIGVRECQPYKQIMLLNSTSAAKKCLPSCVPVQTAVPEDF